MIVIPAFKTLLNKGKAPIWKPSELNSLRFWIEANDPATSVFSGGVLTSLSNKAPGYASSIPPTAHGSLQESVLGSKKAWFSPDTLGNNYISYSWSALFNSNTDDWAVGVVFSLPANGSGTYAVWKQSNANSYLFGRYGNGPLYGINGDTTGSGTISTEFGFDTPTIVVIEKSGTTGNAWTNGALRKSVSVSSALAGSPAGASILTAIFRNGTSVGTTTSHMRGLISEYVVFRNGLATLDRQNLEGYLAHSHGIQNRLPSDHPYRNDPPPPSS